MTNELKQTIKEYIANHVLYEKKTIDLIEKSIWDLKNLIPEEWTVAYTIPDNSHGGLNISNQVVFMFISNKTKEIVYFSLGLVVKEIDNWPYKCV